MTTTTVERPAPQSAHLVKESACIPDSKDAVTSGFLPGLEGGLIPCVKLCMADKLPAAPGAFLIIDTQARKMTGGVCDDLRGLIAEEMDHEGLSLDSVVCWLECSDADCYDRLCRQVKSWSDSQGIDWIFPATGHQQSSTNPEGITLLGETLTEKLRGEIMEGAELVESRISEAELKLLNDFRAGNRGLIESLSALQSQQAELSEKTDRILLSLLELISLSKDELTGGAVERLKRKLSGRSEPTQGEERLAVTVRKELPVVQGWLSHTELAELLGISGKRLSKARQSGDLDKLFEIRRVTGSIIYYRQMAG